MKRACIGPQISPWFIEFNKRKNSLENWNHRKLREVINETTMTNVYAFLTEHRVGERLLHRSLGR